MNAAHAPLPAAYAVLIAAWKRVSLLGAVGKLLGWDQEVNLPPAGAPHRAEQQTLIAGLAHEWRTDPKIGDLIAAAERCGLPPDSAEAACVREMRRDYDRAVKVPRPLVEEMARTHSLAVAAWQEARKKNNFPAFAPWLEKNFSLARRYAEALDDGAGSYDTLLNDYEQGLTAAALDPLLGRLREALPPLAREAMRSRRSPNQDLLNVPFPKEAQAAFARDLTSAIGFDFTGGRLDESAHPFCSTIGPGDTRLTTRYSGRNFKEALYSTIHEMGHGLYEQGLPPEHRGTPLGEGCSSGVHESQSLFWENLIAHSPAFWAFFFPRLQAACPALASARLDDFLFAVNKVEPSFIRIQADEVTYNLHILLRTGLERDMFSGRLPPRDLPGEWNRRFHDLVGLDVPDDAQGCLQDIHWSVGAVGYFPTYSLGHLNAAQIETALRAEVRDLDRLLARGDFSPALAWLRRNIHQHGRRYEPADLVRRVTGQPLSPEPLLAHLREKVRFYYGAGR
ncbi:MAG: carboxypeptidase M32 [Planctomycetes bacterium]|nr:carboxypeptidase M32 [Planctomycetota bacterium]